MLEQRNRDHLEVASSRRRAQVGRQRRFVARRQERGEENQLGNTPLEDRERSVPRLDQHQVDAGQAADGAPDGVGLRGVWFDGENQRHEWRDPSITGMTVGTLCIGATGPTLASSIPVSLSVSSHSFRNHELVPSCVGVSR